MPVMPLDLAAAHVAIRNWIVAQLGAAVAQVTDVTFAGDADGTYTVTIDGVDYAHVSAAQSLTQLIDSLMVLINAGANTCTAVNNGGTALRLTADTAGAGFLIEVAASGGASAMVIANVTANRAEGALVGYAAAPYNVVWGYQDGPKPAHPYAVLMLQRPLASVGGLPARQIAAGAGDTSNERLEHDAEMLLRVEILTRAPLAPDSGMDETVPLLTGLEASAHVRSQLEAFTAAGLALVSTRAMAIPFVAGFSQERRGSIDVVFRARVRVDAIDVPVLEMESLNDITGSVNESEVTITVGTA